MAAQKPSVTPPPGWSMAPEELDYETDWAPEDSWGYQIGVAYNLGKCIPVMCDPVGSEVIFTAGGPWEVL
ncbi:hypothetical protein N7535_000693 [Penicillium sp. DV-2018c]|nr:hypothetical protein N7461_006054 [Penicillium sp. DV-2018c]KAJ5582073.1 hypothetical protein N7535_000693 [Penicillium sp. DV-2018c]